MLNNGRIIPSPASPARKAKSQSPMTTTPADLKNSSACFHRANDADPKDKRANIGSVPRANESITSNPETKDPLESAATCID